MPNMASSEDDLPPLLVDTGQDPQNMRSRIRVPITIVTGYLGAGKTTLLNYVLSKQHGKRIAVILNEFGDSTDIERALTISKGGNQIQEWLEVGNGCICCSVKDSGVSAIESLMEKSGVFDYILLETTGLADPGNIAPLFWVDNGLGSTIYLDGIVTLVDAKNILKNLDEPQLTDSGLHGQRGAQPTTAHLQISHADVIVINKADLVTSDQLELVKKRVEGINGLAKTYIAQQGYVSQLDGILLDLKAYDDVGELDLTNKWHSHLDPNISTQSVSIPPLKRDQLPILDEWLRSILWESRLPGATPNSTFDVLGNFEVHRLKGRLLLEDGTIKFVQGVREIFEIVDAQQATLAMSESYKRGKLVFVGRNIASIAFEESYLRVLDRPSDLPL